MKVCENGVMRDMTAEEIAELQAMQMEQPIAEPTAEERMEALEAAILELAEVIANG